MAPVSILTTVVLPAPDGPITPRMVPSGTVRATSSTATRSPKRFVTWSTTMVGGRFTSGGEVRAGCAGGTPSGVAGGTDWGSVTWVVLGSGHGGAGRQAGLSEYRAGALRWRRRGRGRIPSA